MRAHAALSSQRSVASSSRTISRTSVAARAPLSRPAPRGNRLVSIRAESESNNNNTEGASPSTPPQTPPPPPPPSPSPPKKDDSSTTATVTGAISVVIGLAYLLLVSFLNSRGDLVPPPPEAFGP